MGEPRQHDRPGEKEQRGSDETAAKPVAHSAGGDHRGQGAQADEEKGRTELGHGRVHLLLDVGEENSPGSPEDAEGCKRGERPKPATRHAADWSPRRGLRNADMSGHVSGSDPTVPVGDVSVTPILGLKRGLVWRL
jgi:hypothetical protein